VRAVAAILITAALASGGCEPRRDAAGAAPSALSPAARSAVNDAVRQFAQDVAHGVTREGPAAWHRYFSPSPSFFMASAGPLVFSRAASAANGGGGMPSPPPMPREQTPQQKARDAYNDGVHDVKKADKAQAAAAQATDAGKKDKAAHEAGDRYTQALRKFQEATGLDPQLP